MGALIVHNPSAGEGMVDSATLRALVATIDHVVAYRSVKDDRWRVEARRADVVVVAGGDGTVASVFIEMAGCEVPIIVVATGTANNVARTLRLPTDEPLSVLTSVANYPVRPFDIPSATMLSLGKSVRFVETVGAGLFADLLADKDHRPTAGEGNEDGWQRLGRLLAHSTEVAWTIEIDGTDVSGRYIAVEAMNIAQTGPNITLAPGADPGDGRLDLVVIGADDRQALQHHIERRRLGEEPEWPNLSVHRGRSIILSSPETSRVRIDDQLYDSHPTTNSTNVSIEVDGLSVLVAAGRAGSLVE